jgi:tungstate transport system substrate-binding protein
MEGVFFMNKKVLGSILLALTITLGGCTSSTVATKSTEATKSEPASSATITLATTTSTYDSGLLDYLLPQFKKETGIEVKVVPKGTGEAMELGKRGDADALLVHAKTKEEEFVKEGYGVKRFDVMYNDFIIVGPKEDTAKIKEKAYNDPSLALKIISESGNKFISRGDESGTHTKEKELLKAASVEPKGSWYVSAGKGMGAVLQMAFELKSYTLTDRATYLSMKDKLDLTIVCEKNDKLYNQYGVIKVNPEKHPIKDKEAQKFVDWILSDKVQNELIKSFGKDKYGESLFIPNAKK